MRSDLNFKQILTNPYEYAQIMLKLNKISHKDDHYINNALILRELCSLPSNMNWPLVFDPEDNLSKCLLILQESIDTLKTNLSNEILLAELAENMNREQNYNQESEEPSEMTRESSQMSIDVS